MLLPSTGDENESVVEGNKSPHDDNYKSCVVMMKAGKSSLLTHTVYNKNKEELLKEFKAFALREVPGGHNEL
jgi:hypothetical protein